MGTPGLRLKPILLTLALLEGWPISPVLFNCYINRYATVLTDATVRWCWEHQYSEYTDVLPWMHGLCAALLMFADDIKITTFAHRLLQHLADVSYAHFNGLNVIVNTARGKTEYMFTEGRHRSRRTNAQRDEHTCILTINGVEGYKTDLYKHLGVRISNRGSAESRRRHAKAKLGALERGGCS